MNSNTKVFDLSVIMTCRNEERNLSQTLLSLESQSIKPNEVIIIDDASTDKTFDIIKQFAQRNGWRYHKREKNDERYISIPNALKIATGLLKNEFDYLMILDGDTILEPQYVEKLIKKMDEDSSLGIAGGSLKITAETGTHNYIDDSKIVFGCNRIYTKMCWYDINSGKILNVNSVAWDNEHSQKALNRGYKVSRFTDVISHAQRTPTLQVPPFLSGKLKYQFGYSLPRSLISGLLNRNSRFLAGYLSAWLNNEKKIDEPEYMKKMKKEYNREYLKKIRYKISKGN